MLMHKITILLVVILADDVRLGQEWIGAISLNEGNLGEDEFEHENILKCLMSETAIQS